MAVPRIFATQLAGNVPASYLDEDFAAILAGTAGPLLIPAGSVSAPGFAVVGDATTGFYQNADGQISFASNGANVFTTSTTLGFNLNSFIDTGDYTIPVFQSGAGPIHTTSTTVTEANADGTSEPRNIINRLQAHGTNPYSKVYGQYNGIDYYGDGTLTTGYTLHNYFAIHGSGDVTNGRPIFAHYWFDDGGSVLLSSSVYEAGSTTYDGTSGGFVNNITGFHVATLGHATRTGGAVFGFQIDDQNAASGVQGYRSEIASGANKWAIFCAGSAASYLGGSLQVAGNLVLTGTAATYSADWQDTRTLGAVSGNSFPWTKVITFTSDGTAAVFGESSTISASGASSIASITGHRITASVGTTASTTTSILGVQSIVNSTNAGATTTAASYAALFQLSGAGNVTAFRHFETQNASYSSSGTATTVEGFTALGTGHATLVTTVYQFRAGDTSASSAVYGFRSEITSGTGKAGFYAQGTADNIFNGNMRVGGTTTPTVALDVTGALTTTGLVTTPASGTGSAGLRLPHGSAPSSPVNGDMWTTTSGLFVRINGSTVGPLS